MAASMIQAYNPYVNNTRYTELEKTTVEKKSIQPQQVTQQKKTEKYSEIEHYSNFNADALITKEEKEFFKKLFPDNAMLIDEHILFNRNGSTQNIQVNKGVLLDSRI